MLVGCTDADPVRPRPRLPLDALQRVAVDTSEGGTIYLDVRVRTAVNVDIRYWPMSGGETLQVFTKIADTRKQVLLPRLLPERVYVYDVVATNADGQPGQVERGEFRATPLPADLAAIHFTAAGRLSCPLTMMEFNGNFRGLAILDPLGTPVWSWRTRGGPQGYTRRKNGNFVINDAGYGLYEISPDGRVVHSIDATTQPTLAPFIHHDVLPTPSNTVLFLAQDARVVGDSIVTGDAIWEWTPETGSLLKRMSLFDVLDPARDVGTRSVSNDWLHTNSLTYGNHGNLIVSLNWLDQVISIAPNFGRVEWRLGGRGSTYALAPGAQFRGQHTVQQLANGNILMFDNGRDRVGADRYSRALELHLDNVTHTATNVWSFVPSPAIYAPYVGSARRESNGNTMVHFGLSRGFRGATGPVTTYEVSPRGQILWRLVVENMGGVDLSYRNEPIAFVAQERVAGSQSGTPSAKPSSKLGTVAQSERPEPLLP